MTAPAGPPGVLIELGEGHGAVADAGWPRTRSPHARRRRWRTCGLVAALVLALVVGGAGPLSGPALRLVARVPVGGGSSVLVDGDRVVVLGTGQVLTGFAVPGGRQVWRTPLSVTASGASMTAADGVVLVTRDEDSPDYDNTEAVDEATGRVLWRTRDSVLLPLVTSGTALVQPSGTQLLTLVSMRTGAVRWTVSTVGCQFTFDRAEVPPDPDAFALLCTGGRLDLVRLPAGTVTTVPLVPRGETWPPTGPQLISAGPVLVVEHTDGAAGTVIEAYRWLGGDRAWTRPGFDQNDILYPCGDDVCVQTHGTGVPLDPLTGAVVGTATGAPPGCCVPAAQPVVADGTLLLVPAGRTAPPGSSPATFVVRVQPPATGQALQPYPVDPGHPVGATVVEVVDAAGRVRPLQRLPGVVANYCGATGTYLVCPSAPGWASVWRFPLE